jgi:phosphoadenosine phosphosulfate reductase
MLERVWDTEKLAAINQRLEDRSPRDILSWGFDAFGDDVVMATGFGTSGIVMMDILASLKPEATVFYLDTDLLFPETLALKDQLSEHLGLAFTRVASEVSLAEQEATKGDRLWEKAPDACCYIRKVLPLQQFLADKQAWITGLRRHQSRSRAQTNVVEWDRVNRLVKVNPLAHWTSEDVWSYILLNELPYNPLHDKGYPSIGENSESIENSKLLFRSA